jgi:fructose/tagatose bisphosphate aldolase
VPLILERKKVLDVYAQAAEKNWVIPTFCTENLTTTEAVLSAANDYADKTNQDNLPVTIAITNQYSHRSQSVNYTHTKQWDIGLKLFMADIDVLTGEGSVFSKLNVMTLLDHTQFDTDADLLKWDMNDFSMIMFDASSLPLEQNIELTADFVQRQGSKIVIEGACDEIIDAGGDVHSELTSPDKAKHYFNSTGVDYIVANLGTEHRAADDNLKYHGQLARQISDIIGKKLVLHGTSSVSSRQLENLFSDGVAKVNIWTALERDSAPILFEDMLKNASKIVGQAAAVKLQQQGLLGSAAPLKDNAQIGYYTTLYRQNIIFEKMKDIVKNYFELWYV